MILKDGRDVILVVFVKLKTGGMAWYPPPRFSDSAHEDVDNFIKDFRLYVTASGMTTNNAAGKQRVLAFFESCLTGKAADWYEQKLKNKKGRLTHIRCGMP
ncbi:hypothetical protein RhiirA1_390928 [Rhizophagus irregularis]|uniref:Uncharacterized protein n=1 Tax=Rhizophagus irregularis TaxID=588596 RepID=A0A2I1EF80_9GLOM|nr:hypothetical protein RhiirA1_390928 [Rhizophagus irregularis]PKY20793.1 hypothetical protein RhiirB3_385174 [Rhizophagus irregularis]